MDQQKSLKQERSNNRDRIEDRFDSVIKSVP